MTIFCVKIAAAPTLGAYPGDWALCKQYFIPFS